MLVGGGGMPTNFMDLKKLWRGRVMPKYFIPLKEKLISILDEAGLKQMQREPTRGQNLLDLFCCNKPSLIKSINSIPGISDHNIVLSDCKIDYN